ncbi:MAG: hypothetical protein AUK47_04045 [Deltaproteobacteria bacterium CG2_30_63_29]|nr:MAG: hypothetical protein AUK47_04045 [Deltaproteobacteria bacterium CG2_30_63_29]PIV99830.1 MAG: hypothetical protein COW42_09805 [Deltaproteobacteria bacterium CG17_big_fil_post_rev_8_21_14_2_50_63_7]PJB38521.1 MAG: hypothetical protein CO108_18965 [Deltaproteobacteria bacterium CG_4_9_14_3_um_filter_63_12]
MVKTLREIRKSKQSAGEVQTGSAEPWSVLICSDHHVGEHSKNFDRIEYVKRADSLDRELCAFLEYHGNHRVADRPWRLVINGDFIDFLAVTFMPSRKEIASNPEFEYSDDELRFGLDNSAAKCVWKLEHIAERHKRLFTFLADFVAKGNRLEMLYGNHDVEFFWPSVQGRFVELLTESYFGGERVEGVNEEDFVNRVTFHQWFLHIPGRLYIEHGNQYDDFSSFDRRLRPLMVERESQIAMPLSHLIIRYFVNQYTGFQSHDKDNWTLLDYVHWLRDQGARNVAKVVFLYGSLFSRVWNYTRDVQQNAPSQALTDEHDRLLEVEAVHYKIPVKALQEVSRSRRLPIEQSLWRTIQVTALDKYLLGLAIGSVVLWILAVGVFADVLSGFGSGLFSSGVRLLMLLAIGFLTIFAWFGTTALVASFSEGRLSTSVSPKLLQAAEQIHRLIDVRYVVMGHSHYPEFHQLKRDPPRFYVNTGAWISPERRERHDPHCRSPLTYGLYRWDEDELKIYRWCTRESEPVEFRSDIESDRAPRAERLRPMAVEHDTLIEALEAFQSRDTRKKRRGPR